MKTLFIICFCFIGLAIARAASFTADAQNDIISDQRRIVGDNIYIAQCNFYQNDLVNAQAQLASDTARLPLAQSIDAQAVNNATINGVQEVGLP